MNTWEIMSYFRNIPDFDNESKISTPELLRLINIGNNFVGQSLYPIFSDDLVIELDAGQFDSTKTLYAPDDALYVINVFRETVKSSAIYKKCTKVDVEKKDLIGNDPSYPLRSDYPFVVHEGKQLRIWPVFPTLTDYVNIKIVYRKRLAGLIYGSSTTVGAADTLILDVLASIRNDIYNGYDMAIYKKNTAQGNAWELEKILKVSDYVGSTKVCSFRDTAGADEFAAATEYRYALYPYIPEEFHNLILDSTWVELVKAGRVKGEIGNLEASVVGRINLALKSNGYETLSGRQD